MPQSDNVRRVKAYLMMDALRQRIGPIDHDLVGSIREDRDR